MGERSLRSSILRARHNLIAEVSIPAPCMLLNSNQRMHRMAAAKLTAQWRMAAKIACRVDGAPNLTDRVHLTAVIYKPRGGRWDANNYWPTVKAAVDGMVDAGVLIDDDNKHIIGPDMRPGDSGPARIVIEIRSIE